MKDVRKLREKLSLTKKEMAQKMGVSVRTIELWEKGTTKPSGTASKLLEQLDCDNETISSQAKDNSVSVSAVNGSNVRVGTETERFIAAIDKQAEIMSRQLDALSKRDEQIDRLISILEKK